MFKLESYVTPLLLSYVNKYIKNLKPEDSQLSLWGGDASFCNLDLRLDVLEQELNLPFTFVNGHIHELRIHVPWTKLGSEPIVITINTIECVLKLHCDNDIASDTSGSTTSSKVALSRRGVTRSKEEAPEAPPGYLQSLINRVISNICIVCNNLILKYVEDDIVLSLNVKSAELFNSNDKWERAFVDANFLDIVHKVISMQDLTVCLDKRDASGKIEAYQDPLLYRCSTVWRIYTLYSTPQSEHCAVTRINMYCDKLDFSLTDQQLPMFLRIIKLCYSLQCKDAYVKEKSNFEETAASSSYEESAAVSSEVSGVDSWGSWVWSFVPFWNQDSDGNDQEAEKMKLQKITQFGIFVDKASCVFKTTETLSEASYYSSKYAFTPFAICHLSGCSMELTMRGRDFFNAQLGVTGISINGMHSCICGFKDFGDDATQEVSFLKAGIQMGVSHSYSFLTSTLFDPLAPENCSQIRTYCFEKQLHLSQLTEDVMMQRYPALAVDYVYELQYPDEWLETSSAVTSTFLENSNWQESSACRFVIGPFCADISSSFIHFIQKLLYCAKDYEYPSYFGLDSDTELLKNIEVKQEDILSLEEFVPHRTFSIMFFKPLLRLCVADHQHFDVLAKVEKRRMKRKRKLFSRIGFVLKSSFVLHMEIASDCMKMEYVTPMYPRRIVKVASTVSPVPENILYYCFEHYSLKVLGVGIQLVQNQQGAARHLAKTIVPPTSVTAMRKQLCLPHHWVNMSSFPQEETKFQCDSICIQLVESHILSLICLYQSWIAKYFSFESLTQFTSLEFNKDEKEKMTFQASELLYTCIKTCACISYKGWISSICVKLKNYGSSAIIFQAPELTKDVYLGEKFFKSNSNSDMKNVKWLQFLCQHPGPLSSDPYLLLVNVRGAAVCLEPALLNWLSNKVPEIHSVPLSATSQQDFDDDSTSSTQTPIASSSFSYSRSQSVIMNERTTATIFDDLQQLLIDNHVILKHLIIQVTVESCVVLLPKYHWCVYGSQKSSSLQSWKDAIYEKRLPTACILCLPKVLIKNSGHNIFEQNFNLVSIKLPIALSKEENKYDDCFPWTLKIENLSMYSIHNNRKHEKILFFCNPTTVSITIGATLKTCQSRLSLCIHVDTTALSIKSSASQVLHIISCFHSVSVCIHVSNFLNSWMLFFVQKLNVTKDGNPVVSLTKGQDSSEPKILEAVEKEERRAKKGHGATDCFSFKQKVSLWIQFTLSKFDLNFYGKFSPDDDECFNFQITSEEVITSLDIQDVYTKAKMKISSLNVNCLSRQNDDSIWSPGPYQGIILCSDNKIRRQLKSIASSDYHSSGNRMNINLDNQPFLLFTFTQALCRNANEKWTVDMEEDFKTNQDSSKYISEADVSVRQFDVILWLSLFKVIVDAISPLKSLFEKPDASRSNVPFGIKFSNQTLPLVYVKTNAIRLFIPKYRFPSAELSGKLYFQQTVKPDIVCLNVEHINLTSQVENPLARILLNSDLYLAAVNSKTILLPGSDVEDRQYQLNMYGLSLDAVHGPNIMEENHLEKGNSSTPFTIMGENPALEWNIGVVNESRKLNAEEPLPVVPLLSPFDINLTFAPAIVSSKLYQEAKEAAVVAGITVETSITNDIFVYLSARHIALLEDITNVVFEHLNGIIFSTKKSSKLMTETHSESYLDSGVESETSTFINATSNFPHARNSETYAFIPFEILVTAGSIVIVCFAHEDDFRSECQKDIFEKSYLYQNSSSSCDADNRTNNLQSTAVTVEKNEYLPTSFPQKGNVSKFIPFFFISVMQPHAFTKCYPDYQKVEVSCYDFLVKGSQLQYIEPGENLFVPLLTAFNLCYIETKSGERNSKTGIPPAFFTFNCTDLFCDISNINVRIERPMKITVNPRLWSQIEMFIASLGNKLPFGNFFGNQKLETVEVNAPTIYEQDKPTASVLMQIGMVEFCTTHLLLDFAVTDSQKILLSVEELKTKVILEPSQCDIKLFRSSISVQGLAFKIFSDTELWPFCYPLSAVMTLKFHLVPCFQVKAYVDCGTLLINLSLQCMASLLSIIDDAREFIELKILSIPQSSKVELKPNVPAVNKENTNRQFWNDDLRKGLFSFIQSSNGDNLYPQVHQIVFTKGQVDRPAAMTWRYPQPRTLTRIEVSPVPYANAAYADDEYSPQVITCQVQYWDSLNHEFVKKCDFQLSETSHCYLDFPLTDIALLTFSDTWRVVVIYSEGDNTEENALILSPLALAACMSIESCYDPSLVPSTQATVSFSSVRVHFFLCLKKCTSNSRLSHFTFDDTNPGSQEFLTLCLTAPCLQLLKWSSGFKVEGSLELSCKVLEYKNLTMFPLLEPASLQFRSLGSYEVEQIPLGELEIKIQQFLVRMSQSVIHTLTYALQSIKEYTQNESMQSVESMLPNYYIICNNIVENVRFGQANTEESIILAPQSMHAYSWHSHKSKQLLHISFQSSKWKWSKPFCIDDCGIHVIALKNGFTVYMNIVSLSNLQKQIVFEGSVSIFNLLSQDVFLKIRSITHEASPKEKVVSSVLRKTDNATFILPAEFDLGFSIYGIRKHPLSSKWIDIRKNEVAYISLGEEDVYHVLLHVVHTVEPNKCHYINIFLCPPFILCNHLPFALEMEAVSTSDASLVIPGEGAEAQVMNNWRNRDCVKLMSKNNIDVDIPLSNLKLIPKSSIFQLSDVVSLKNELSSNKLARPNGSSNNSFGNESSEQSEQNNIASVTSESGTSKINIKYSRKWKWLDTVVFTVKPLVVLHNNIHHRLTLLQSDSKEWELAPDSKFVPLIPLEKSILLNIEIEGNICKSDLFWILEEKGSKYPIRFDNVLPISGSMIVAIPTNTGAICLLHLKSRIENGIRSIVFCSSVQIKNTLNHDLHLAVWATSELEENVIFGDASKVTAVRSGEHVPLILWNSKHESPTISLNKQMHTFYVSFCCCSNFKHNWSRPLRLSPDFSVDRRFTIALPVELDAVPLVITAHKRQERLFLVVAEDNFPFILLHNQTDRVLFFGQSIVSEWATIFEETECGVALPSIPPGGSTYYTFPMLQQNFPVPVDSLPKMHFGCEDKVNNTCVWSPPVNVSSISQFVSLPGMFYIRVSKELNGHTIRLFLSVVNKVELTADDVRSRIGLTNARTIYLSVASTVDSSEAEHVATKKSISKSAYNSSLHKDKKTLSSPVLPFSLSLSIGVCHFSFIVYDELTQLMNCVEILRLNIDDISVNSHTKKTDKLNLQQEFHIHCVHLQLDNQLDQEGKLGFDFPVILKPHLILDDSNKNQKSCFLTADITFGLSVTGKKVFLKSLNVVFEPISLYLEDAMYSKLMSLYISYIPYSFLSHGDCNNIFPRDVDYVSVALVNPLRINKMSVNIKEVYLTLHASIKLYLSIENSLLKFQPLEREELFTNFYELGRITVIHYLTGALFRAGWVVGALDLLGNPANFARAVGIGISDFIRLPYQGFLNGPKCFIAGLSHGAVSLLSGISSGAITCMTNLATSISRNMDLLSLDDDHMARQELLRRQLPAGITGGLVQGLSGFGLCLLGAVAGVVDHPLQVFVSSQSPLETAKGVVGGLGKGLIGIVTKPVGGAAEFVSQTGHGLLNRAGWLSQPNRKYVPISVLMKDFATSPLKYKSKVFQNLGFGEVLLLVDATLVDRDDISCAVTLLLTSNVLCIINPNEDADQKAFSLNEIKCETSGRREKMILVSSCKNTEDSFYQDPSSVNDRVAEYVQKNWICDSENSLPCPFSEDEAKLEDVFMFLIHPDFRNMFLTMFNAARRKILKKEFSIC